MLFLKYIQYSTIRGQLTKANGYLKMSCNILANIKEHYVGYEWQFLKPLYADDTFQYS